MIYKLFIFDFDGTLVDSRDNIANSMNTALKAKGLSRIDPDLIYPTIGKMPIQDVFTKFCDDLSEDDLGFLVKSFRKALLGNALSELTLFPGVEGTLHEAQLAGVQLAILTTKPRDVIESVLSALKIDGFFSVIYGSGMLGGNKPDKGCVEYIWQHISEKVLPEETVMVGDTVVDLSVAENSEIDSIGVTYGIDGEKIRNENFTHVISDFNEILKFVR